jgi:hypothetical protein
MRFDLVNQLKVVQVLAAAARAADANGTLDTDGFHSITIIPEFGGEGVTLSATDKVEVKVEHSDASGSGFVAVKADDLILPAGKAAALVAPDTNGVILVLDDNAEMPAVYPFGYKGSKRYVKVTLDFSGTHGTATPCAVTAVLSHPEYAPV